MVNLESLSYGIAAAAFLILTLLLLTSWRGRLQGGLLVAASAVTALWAGVTALFQIGVSAVALPAALLEVLRGLVWNLFLLNLLSVAEPGWRGLLRGTLARWSIGLTLLGLLLAALAAAPLLLAEPLGKTLGIDTRLLGHLVMAVAGLVLVEQLFRNARLQDRWAIKYLCLGVGGLFAYDFFMFSDALLFKRLDVNLWQARGLINTLVVPLIAVSAARNPQWSLDVFVSRRMVFHSAAILAAGVYLLLMAAGGMYVRLYGGNWGHAAQAVFLFGALLVLVIILFSGQAQARLRVFLNKHFFNYKYDYREEWLRFIGTLSEEESGRPLRERAIQAVAKIMDSPGGALWWRREPARYEFVAHWNMSEAAAAPYEPADGPLVRFLAGREWVIDLNEYDDKPEAYADLTVPGWLRALERGWLVVPLMHHEDLLGFMVLAQPLAPRQCNWEDNDLLKTAGRQAASHLAQLEAAEALANARQFEAFNRLSAFLIHDMKNVAAQLSLLVNNAGRHRHKPEFVDDAFKTIDNAAVKMNRLLTQLRSGTVTHGRVSQISLEHLLEEVVALHGQRRPVPTLVRRVTGLSLTVERDHLADVLGHIIQNAQEATPPEGSVEVVLQEADGMAVIEVVDSGCGMDDDFIRDRLFRPFDSTKGRSGMGIGAYEAREFVRGLGGRLDVYSVPGRGTRFRFELPLAKAEGGKGQDYDSASRRELQ